LVAIILRGHLNKRIRIPNASSIHFKTYSKAVFR